MHLLLGLPTSTLMTDPLMKLKTGLISGRRCDRKRLSSPCWEGPGLPWHCRSPQRLAGFHPYRRCAAVCYHGDPACPHCTGVSGGCGPLQPDTSVQPGGGLCGHPGHTHTHKACRTLKDTGTDILSDSDPQR